MATKKNNLNQWMNKLKRIEERVERLALLSQLSQILNSTLDHKEVRRRAMEAATQLMKAEVGSLLLVDEEKRQLKEIIPGVKYHHEQLDGRGYPEGLKGDAIPVIAKIVPVAGTYDAMTTDRPYRKALGKGIAIEELKRCSGTQFDRDVVEAFIQAYQMGEI